MDYEAEATIVDKYIKRLIRMAALIAGRLPDKQFADLASTPVRPVLLRLDDQALDLFGQLVGIAYWTSRAVTQRLHALLSIAIVDLVPCLVRNPERATDLTRCFSVENTGNKT